MACDWFRDSAAVVRRGTANARRCTRSSRRNSTALSRHHRAWAGIPRRRDARSHEGGARRRLENLPRFMSHLESVARNPDGRSRRVATGPADYRVEWDTASSNCSRLASSRPCVRAPDAGAGNDQSHVAIRRPTSGGRGSERPRARKPVSGPGAGERASDRGALSQGRSPFSVGAKWHDHLPPVPGRVKPEAAGPCGLRFDLQ